MRGVNPGTDLELDVLERVHSPLDLLGQRHDLVLALAVLMVALLVDAVVLVAVVVAVAVLAPFSCCLGTVCAAFISLTAAFALSLLG